MLLLFSCCFECVFIPAVCEKGILIYVVLLVVLKNCTWWAQWSSWTAWFVCVIIWWRSWRIVVRVKSWAFKVTHFIAVFRVFYNPLLALRLITFTPLFTERHLLMRHVIRCKNVFHNWIDVKTLFNLFFRFCKQTLPYFTFCLTKQWVIFIHCW